jgi:hypothetical protein
MPLRELRFADDIAPESSGGVSPQPTQASLGINRMPAFLVLFGVAVGAGLAYIAYDETLGYGARLRS